MDIGAVVHRKAVVGAGVHIASGAVVGPDVTIGKSTKIGYFNVFLLMFETVDLLSKQCLTHIFLVVLSTAMNFIDKVSILRL